MRIWVCCFSTPFPPVHDGVSQSYYSHISLREVKEDIFFLRSRYNIGQRVVFISFKYNHRETIWQSRSKREWLLYRQSISSTTKEENKRMKLTIE